MSSAFRLKLLLLVTVTTTALLTACATTVVTSTITPAHRTMGDAGTAWDPVWL